MSVCNGKIYILGGRRENGEATDTILCYDPATSIITGVAAMPRPFEMSLLTWCLINASSHVAHQMGTVWCIGQRFQLETAEKWAFTRLLGLSFLSKTGKEWCLDNL